jgi:transposase-like protein
MYRWAENGGSHVPKPTQFPGRPLSADTEQKQHDRSVSGASVESASPRARRTFTAAEKQRIVKAAAVAGASGKRGAIEALLRKEGIYSSHLSAWRQQLEARGASALEPQTPGRKPAHDAKDRELLALTKRNAELERKLALANAVIGLQKKVHAILGIALPSFDEES